MATISLTANAATTAKIDAAIRTAHGEAVAGMSTTDAIKYAIKNHLRSLVVDNEGRLGEKTNDAADQVALQNAADAVNAVNVARAASKASAEATANSDIDTIT